VKRKSRTTPLATYLKNTAGATQGSLAQRVGVSRSYMSLLVSGKRQPGVPLALRLEAATGVSVKALIPALERMAS